MHAASKPRHVDVVVNGWICRAHFDGGIQDDELLADKVVYLVNEAGKVLA